jgi:hypothetical protein
MNVIRMPGWLRRATGLLAVCTLFLSAACGKASPTSPSGGRSLEIDGPPFIEVGGTGYQFVLFDIGANGLVSDVTTDATWTSSSSQIASFSFLAGRPILSVFRSGKVVITASYKGKSASLTFTVP